MPFVHPRKTVSRGGSAPIAAEGPKISAFSRIHAVAFAFARALLRDHGAVRPKRRRPPPATRRRTRSSARTRKPGNPPERMGCERRRRPQHPGLRDRHQRQPRRDGPLQGRHRLDRLPPRHLPDGLLRRRRRPQGRQRSSRRSPCLRSSHPAKTEADDRPGRLRQLGGIGLLAGARPTPSPASTSPSSCGTTSRSEGSHIVFVVRDDDGHSDLLFQTSDTTWQAYNHYGGNSLYEGGPGTDPGRAYKVSYNRPLTTRGPTPEDDPFNAEYPMVRWLERNGYDVSYFTGVDTDRRGAEMLEHKAYPLGRPRRVLVGRAARERRSGARRRGQPRLLQRQRGLLEDPLGRQHRRVRHATTAPWSATRRPTPTPRSTRNRTSGPEPGAIRASARQRRRPARERAHRHDLHRQLRHRRDRGPGGRREDAALAQHRASPRWHPAKRRPSPPNTLGYEWDEDLDNGFRPAGPRSTSPRRRWKSRSACSTTAPTTDPAPRPIT